MRVGDAVLAPVGDEAAATELAELVDGLREDGFRLARPLRACDGAWVAGGWTASRWITGETGPSGRWPELLEASRALHAALGAVRRPTHLARRADRWAAADRMAWGEEPMVAPSWAVALVGRLAPLGRPAEEPSQLVHGDLSGNVLFAPGLVPGVIDLSSYWRPVRYAEAVVAVDALLWYDEDESVVELVGGPALLPQALLFRLCSHPPMSAAEAQRVVAVVEALEGWLRR